MIKCILTKTVKTVKLIDFYINEIIRGAIADLYNNHKIAFISSSSHESIEAL